MEAELRVHALDVPELAGVRKVLAVPGEEEVALVEGGHGEVERISDRVSRHDSPQDIDIHDVGDGGFERKERQILHESERLAARGERREARGVVAAPELLEDRKTRGKLKPRAGEIPQ